MPTIRDRDNAEIDLKIIGTDVVLFQSNLVILSASEALELAKALSNMVGKIIEVQKEIDKCS